MRSNSSRAGWRLGAAGLAWLLLLSSSWTTGCDRAGRIGSEATAGRGEGGGAPRLVVVVIIDQFRADYLTRFADRFGEGGFRRLLREGAHFTNCFYPYLLTDTGPGNATLATGTTPDHHGIVANAWYDDRLGRYSAAAEDDRYAVLGAAHGLTGASPRKLVASTLADEMSRSSGGASRVFGLAGKDRAAIFSSGHAATGAFWLDRESGRFVSSTYYYPDGLPGWVRTFNERRPVDRFYGRVWEVEGRPPILVAGGSGKPDREFFERFAMTPYMHDYLLEFARELVEQEELGADAATDYLSIGLSGHDWLGHAVGPYDPAVAAMTQRTDAQLAALLEYLDERVGRGRYWVALASDHGVAPTVRQARRRDLPGMHLDMEALRTAMSAAVETRWSAGHWLLPAGHWTRVRINPDLLETRHATLEEVARLAGEAAREVPGVLGYFTPGHSDLDAATREAARLSTFPGRSPDLLILTEPYVLITAGDVAAHGTQYPYDSHVPLVLWGGAFLPGTYDARSSPTDLVPTLAAALGIAPPADATGRVLTEALIPPASRPGASVAAGED